MRETVIDGEKFYVFQDVCRELVGQVLFTYMHHLSEKNHARVKLPSGKQTMKKEIVVNAAGVEELRKALKMPKETQREPEKEAEMHELIKVEQETIGGATIQTVNARDLHAFLGVGKDFTNWAKVQIERARLVENRDFMVFTQKGVNPTGGRPTSEYHLTLDAGKHIAMMSGTDKGFEVRDYFIECERQAKQAHIDPMQALNDPAAMRGLLLSYTEKVLTLQSENAALAPKAQALDRIATATEGSVCITNAAKDLQTRPKELFDYLSSHRWIYKRHGGRGWVAYQDKLQQGVLEHKITTVERADGSEKITEQVLITAKGMAKLAGVFQPLAEMPAAASC